jgi:LPXTG-site transpeptidase (sortase) family protein
VPQSADGNWDVSWLENEAGWLQGSAYPTWSGNSVLTGHVYNALGQPGPFAALNTLGWGDQIIIHAGVAEYVYEVRSVKQVSPQNVNAMMQHEESPWITLVTCRGYNEDSNSYLYRLLVRAVMVEVK